MSFHLHCVSKKFPPLNSLSCQILTDFQNVYTAGKCMKFATKPIWNYPPHLSHVATLPWEIKNSNFLQIAYSAIIPDMKENANKLHFKCTDFSCSTCVTVYPECIDVFLSKSFPRRWIPCWSLTNTAVTSAVTNFWCHKLIAKVNK